MAATGVPLRTLQEWMGHRDFKTTLIDADYSPSEHETEVADAGAVRGRADADEERRFRHCPEQLALDARHARPPHSLK